MTTIESTDNVTTTTVRVLARAGTPFKIVQVAFRPVGEPVVLIEDEFRGVLEAARPEIEAAYGLPGVPVPARWFDTIFREFIPARHAARPDVPALKLWAECRGIQLP